MSSSCVVPITAIKNIREHSNADSLQLADVLGYQMCIPINAYKEGDLVVYFPADTLIPDNWAVRFNVKNFLKGKDKDRVGKIRLRGEPSFGLVVPIPKELSDVHEGDNVAEFFGATKYEPPIRATAGDASVYDENIDPYFDRYTDIENGRIFVDVFKEGEEVVITEKLHGTNEKCGYINGVPVAGSMSVRRKHPVDSSGNEVDFDSETMKANIYWHPWSIRGVKNFLDDNKHNNILLYGEIIGNVQSLKYGCPNGVTFRAFDVKINGTYLNWNEFEQAMIRYNIPYVPVLYKGMFNFKKAIELADGKTILDDNHIREGVVVKPIIERTDTKVGRAVVKIIGTEYSLSKNSDFKDV